MSRTLRIAAKARRGEAHVNWTPDPNTIHLDDVVDRPSNDAAAAPRSTTLTADEGPILDHQRGGPTGGADR